MKSVGILFLSLAISCAGFLGACTAIVPDDGGQEPLEPAVDAMPDFSLTDVNPASARFGEEISPRDYLGKVSAWYFGHST